MNKNREWAVDLRPSNLENMVGQEVNREIMQGWIKNDNLPNAVIFYGRSGTGKALRNGTKVLTSEGYKAIEALQLTDKVAGTDGKFHELLGIYPQGKKSMYKLSFNQSREIYASGDHLWTVKVDSTAEYVVLTTEHLDKIFRFSNAVIQLPTYEALEKPEVILTSSPYTVGVEIANNHLSNASNSFLRAYLDSSIKQRTQLLSGILDGAGIQSIDVVAPAQAIEIHSKKIVHFIEELANSLSIAVKCAYDVPLLDSETKEEVGKTNTITFSASFIPSDDATKKKFDCSRTILYGVEKVEDAECTCIAIDSEDHLFIAEHGIVTHNTTSARALAKAVNAEVIELDAASHNGVEDARQINEQAARLSLTGKRKIFIIDECFVEGTKILTPNGEVPIEALQPYDFVKNLLGTSMIMGISENLVPKDRIITLNFSNGSSTSVTKEHLYLTDRGWIEAEKLQANDVLFGNVSMIWNKATTHRTSQAVFTDYTIKLQSHVAFSHTYRDTLHAAISLFTDEIFDDKDAAIKLITNFVLHRAGFKKELCDISPEDYRYFGEEWLRAVVDKGYWKPEKNADWQQTLFEIATACLAMDNNQVKKTSLISTQPFKSNQFSNLVRVYDLQVDNHPSYIADGVTVHNCHMLSNAAWNTLLKNIEEPNPKTTFIFATTDYAKLPATIRGRSRMLKFYSVPDEELKEYALAVLEHEGYALKDEVVNLIVQQAKGQVRDLLKLLQTAAESNLNDIDKLKKFLAIPDSKGMRTFINAVLAPAPKTGVKILNSIETDLLEWIAALQAHIYELLEDKYEIRPMYFGDNITLKQQVKKVEEKFTDRQFGALLTELNKIQSANTAYAQLYALLFRGVS